MWSVSGLSCRKSGSCHSHIDDGVCLCSHWNHLFLSSSFMCIYAMNWMNFYDWDIGLLSLFCFPCSFWCTYNNIVLLICQHIFVFYFKYFILFVVLFVSFLLFVLIFYYFLYIYVGQTILSGLWFPGHTLWQQRSRHLPAPAPLRITIWLVFIFCCNW